MLATRRVKLEASALVASLALFIVPELVWPTQFRHPKVQAEVFALNDLNLAARLYRQEKGVAPTSLEQMHREKYIVGLATTDHWGHLRVLRQRETGEPQIYSVGVNGRDEDGAGDDVVVGPKTYRCEDYGVNCPRSISEWGRIVTLVVALASALALVLEAVWWGCRAVLRRIRRAGTTESS